MIAVMTMKFTNHKGSPLGKSARSGKMLPKVVNWDATATDVGGELTIYKTIPR
jgi:hypothetical protein